MFQSAAEFRVSGPPVTGSEIRSVSVVPVSLILEGAAVHAADADLLVRFDGEAEAQRRGTHAAEVVFHTVVARNASQRGTDILPEVRGLLGEGQAEGDAELELLVGLNEEASGELADEERDVEILRGRVGAGCRGRCRGRPSDDLDRHRDTATLLNDEPYPVSM